MGLLPGGGFFGGVGSLLARKVQRVGSGFGCYSSGFLADLGVILMVFLLVS